MRHLLSIALILATIFVLSGCGRNGLGFSNRAPQLVAEPDTVSAMLANAADRAANSLETLAAIEYERSPGVAVGPVGDAPVEMRRAVTVQWVGSVEPLVQNLADRASYNFLVVGSTPSVPIVVSLDTENMPIVEILRDVGLQMGLRADIRIDSQRRIVEIHYPPPSGVGS